MIITEDIAARAKKRAETSKLVLALGNFDGFHQGHQVVVGEAGRIARARGLPLAVFTTEPHPRSYFAPEAVGFRLTGYREKAVLLENFGIDELVVAPFDEALATTEAESFVSDILHKKIGVAHIVVGYDYRFGNGRKGDVGLLRRMGTELGFEVGVVEPVSIGVEGEAGQVYSSTLVRDSLQKGEARHAAALLGHWWGVVAEVEQGDQRGRQIGFPTANMGFGDLLVPRHGVYAVRVMQPGTNNIFPGVANVGVRPTFDGDAVKLESHLFDAQLDLYGQELRVEFVAFIREEKRFDGVEALKAQIVSDCEVARRILSDPENLRDRLLPPTLDGYLERFPAPLI